MQRDGLMAHIPFKGPLLMLSLNFIEVWLMDNYKKDSLDLRHNTTYTFDMSDDPNSYGPNRFQLVIRQNPALGVHLLNFAANKASGGAQVVWKTENEQNYTNFTVERSR